MDGIQHVHAVACEGGPGAVRGGELLTDSEKNGEENRKLQTEHFKLAPSLPTYVRVTADGKVVKVLAGWEPDEERFLEFLGK